MSYTESKLVQVFNIYIKNMSNTIKLPAYNIDKILECSLQYKVYFNQLLIVTFVLKEEWIIKIVIFIKVCLTFQHEVVLLFFIF